MARNRVRNEEVMIEHYDNAVQEHDSVFGNTVMVGYHFCYGRMGLDNNTTDEFFKCPDTETTQQFDDRIARSIEAGRNLFFEEWEKLPHYREDATY